MLEFATKQQRVCSNFPLVYGQLNSGTTLAAQTENHWPMYERDTLQ